MIRTRNTSQKQLILETIKHLDHPTCDEIYAAVLKKDKTIGRATVFRNVKALTEKHLLTKIIVPQGALHYDISVQNHSHFICKSCGKIFDIPYEADIKLPQLDHFSVEGYNLIFTGLCEECKKKKER